MSSNASALFTPFDIGPISLNNRLVMAPMSRNLCPTHIPNDEMRDYYARRAKGEVGLIFTEASFISHPSAHAYPDVPYIYGDEAIAGWTKVTDACHAENTPIFIQLWHTGSFRPAGYAPDPNVPAFAPTAVVNKWDGNDTPAQAMTLADIEAVIASYAEGAANAQKAGFDGVEVHAAHGYLIDEFFWAKENTRTDRYGGSFENRLKFACDILSAMRLAVGPDFPISIRFSQWKQQDYSARICETPDQLETFLRHLGDAGASIFHASNRRIWEPEFEGSPHTFSGWCKKVTDKPVIGVGSVGIGSSRAGDEHLNKIDPILDLFEQGEFDLLAIGRRLLADPNWVKFLKQGSLEKARPYHRDLHNTLY